jgi:hypothetical protein
MVTACHAELVINFRKAGPGDVGVLGDLARASCSAST